MLIEINDKKIGLKFNKYAFEELAKIKLLYANNGNKIDFEVKNTSAFAISLIYCGYKGWCFVKQIDEELSLEDFSDWYDLTLNNSEINDIIAEIFREYENSEISKFAQKKSQENGQLLPV